MFNSPILDLIILLSFTYFIGSLILTSANEFIAAVFRLRQNQLKDALENLFPGVWQNFVQTNFIKSPHIQSLMKASDKYPVYIPAKNFVSALIQQIGSANFNAVALPAAIQASPLPPEMQQVMLDLLAKTQNNLDAFQKELETFYNDAMDRAGGWYKRKIRTIMLVLGGAVAIALNIDTIKIAQDSLQDSDKLSKTVDNITAQMSKVNMNGDTFVIKDKNNNELIKMTSRIDTASVAPIVNPIGDSTQKDSSGNVPVSTMKESQKNIKNLKIIYEQNTGYTLGYNGNFCKEWQGWNILKKLLGVLITVFAFQLGSNYWFDMLNRTINIRAAGKKPGEQKKE